MPVQDAVVPPWEWLLDAQCEAQDALRHEDHIRQTVALADLQAAKESVRCLGGLLVLYGLDTAEAQKKVMAVVGGLAREAWDRARAAEARATRAVEELDALRCRLREVERLLADATAGIGRPGL